jgi:1,4-alpha-glucan branching enzyme
VQRRFGTAATTRVIFTESHDADGNGRTRLPTEIDPSQSDSWWSKKRSTLAAALTFTARNPDALPRARVPRQRPVSADNPPLDWSGATTHPGILQLYRDLIASAERA